MMDTVVWAIGVSYGWFIIINGLKKMIAQGTALLSNYRMAHERLMMVDYGGSTMAANIQQ